MEIDHLGIAVHRLSDALPAYEATVGASAPAPELVESQGVRVTFLEVGGTHLEFLEPARPDAPIAQFLEKRGEGIHHIAFHVPSVAQALHDAAGRGAKLIDPVPRPGARGRRVGFVHPSAYHGVLVEFVEGA
jgi:methylmalonyl-CoA epimerase